MTSTDLIAPGPPAWPGCALGSWTAAWLAGRCAPDDVTDTLSDFADRHDVVDTTDAARADDEHARLGLLALLRRGERFSVRLPTAGDPQGLPPAPATAAALSAGEILLVDRAEGTTLGLVPELIGDTCRWSMYRYERRVTAASTESLGQIEYDLREAIRETTDIVGALGSGGLKLSPAALRSALATLTARHQITLPPHDDARASRVIDSAARVEAIVTLAGAQAPTFGVTAGHVELADTGLRRLAAMARSARAAAVNQVIG
ncbi:MAG: hypothetical protein SW127_18115, partial [Actinomycetota bacterium]|nr:hypothetical protein [Actinomycetota bacterium]